MDFIEFILMGSDYVKDHKRVLFGLHFWATLKSSRFLLWTLFLVFMGMLDGMDTSPCAFWVCLFAWIRMPASTIAESNKKLPKIRVCRKVKSREQVSLLKLLHYLNHIGCPVLLKLQQKSLSKVLSRNSWSLIIQ